MRLSKQVVAVVAVMLVLVIGALALGTALAGGPREVLAEARSLVMDDDEGDTAEDEAEGRDVAITGSALEQASAAALEHLGEGRVTDTEVGDEEGYYEVEVTLDNGNEVDVHLDEAFQVLGTEADGTADND